MYVRAGAGLKSAGSGWVLHCRLGLLRAWPGGGLGAWPAGLAQKPGPRSGPNVCAVYVPYVGMYMNTQLCTQVVKDTLLLLCRGLWIYEVNVMCTLFIVR
jgi:hypothetical protein